MKIQGPILALLRVWWRCIKRSPGRWWSDVESWAKTIPTGWGMSFNPSLIFPAFLCVLALHSKMFDWFIATDGQFKITKLSISLFLTDKEGGHFPIVWYTFKIFMFPIVLFVTNLLPQHINTAGFMLRGGVYSVMCCEKRKCFTTWGPSGFPSVYLITWKEEKVQ